MIHTVKGCPACDNLKKPVNFTKFKDAILAVDPTAQIKIFEHPSWGTMVRKAEYPNFGGITWAPTLMVTTQDNMSSSGDPTKLKIYNGRYNPATKSLVKTESGKGTLEGVVSLVNEVLATQPAQMSQTSIIPPIDNSPPRISPPVLDEEAQRPKEKGKVKCKFVLVSAGTR